jgi:hypothetical protein
MKSEAFERGKSSFHPSQTRPDCSGIEPCSKEWYAFVDGWCEAYGEFFSGDADRQLDYIEPSR